MAMSGPGLRAAAIPAAGLAIALLIYVWGPSWTVPRPVETQTGTQSVAYYRPAQARAVERHMGGRLVHPEHPVAHATGLHLSALVVTEIVGTKTIHYVFGDFAHSWVLVSETPGSDVAAKYDAASDAYFFEARGAALILSGNQTAAVMVALARALGDGSAGSAGSPAQSL